MLCKTIWRSRRCALKMLRQPSVVPQVGSAPTAAELDAADAFLRDHRATVQIVSVDWLRACHAQQARNAGASRADGSAARVLISCEERGCLVGWPRPGATPTTSATLRSLPRSALFCRGP